MWGSHLRLAQTERIVKKKHTLAVILSAVEESLIQSKTAFPIEAPLSKGSWHLQVPEGIVPLFYAVILSAVEESPCLGLTHICCHVERSRNIPFTEALRLFLAPKKGSAFPIEAPRGVPKKLQRDFFG